jgi:EmrB/QacA subfamily drug resistance transporter
VNSHAPKNEKTHDAPHPETFVMNDSHNTHPPTTFEPLSGTELTPHLLRIALVVVLGAFMSMLDMTIVNVAIRDLSNTFQVPLTTTQWVSTGYMLALATVIPLTGWAADRFGTKRLYTASILLFVLGSALSGTAWSASTLILFRVLQGLGGGMIMPAGMTILSHAAGPQRIGRMMGLMAVPMLLAPILGPVLGGWLVDNASWRWIFFINLPIGAIALYATSRALETDEPKPHHALDWTGLLLLSPGLTSFVFGLAEIADAGNLRSLTADACAAGGLASIVAFVLHARRHQDPLIDVRLFRRRTVGAAALTTALFGAAFFGMLLLLPLYFQVVRAETAFASGLLIAAQGLGGIISAPIASRMVDRSAAGRIVLLGLALVALGMLGLSQIGGDTPLWSIEATLFIIGLGGGATMMPTMSAALSSLQRHEVARATSGLNVTQRVGSSIGITVLAVVLSQALARLVPEGGSIVSAQRARALPALGHAFGHTFLWAFGIVLLAICAALFLPRKKPLTIPGQSVAPPNPDDVRFLPQPAVAQRPWTEQTP